MFKYRGNPGHRIALPVHGLGNDQNGITQIPNPVSLAGPDLRIVFANGEGWEHVSVSTATRIPSWLEMCAVKKLFWDPEDCVMQLHPPESQYVNCHPNCLHLWRPIDRDIPQPPPDMVGPPLRR